MNRKNLFALLLLLCTAITAQAQLLWKVSGKALPAPSYVLGTYHLAKTSFADSIAGLKQALNECQQVYGEINMISMASDPNAISKVQQAMLLPEGQTLESLFTAEQLTRLNDFLRNNLGADLSNPALAALKQMRPASLSNQLQLLLCLKLDPGFNPNEQFDAYFQKQATELHKQVGGLETLEEQMQLLFENTSLSRQAEQLMCLVDNTPHQIKLLQRTIQAYYAQDLNEIEKVMNEKQHTTCDATPEEEEALIYSRNARWAEKLPGLMKQGPTFIAVGAAHLVGPKGLLELLKKAGYEVEAVSLAR